MDGRKFGRLDRPLLTVLAWNDCKQSRLGHEVLRQTYSEIGPIDVGVPIKGWGKWKGIACSGLWRHEVDKFLELPCTDHMRGWKGLHLMC